MTANKNAITTRAISKRDELRALLTEIEVGVAVGTEVGVAVGTEDGVAVGTEDGVAVGVGEVIVFEVLITETVLPSKFVT